MTDPYQAPAAVESAIRSAAQKAARNDKSLSVQERIRLEYFHRFLCRIFSKTPTDAWLLKGGTALLARVASARATSDVDLFNRRHSLAAALTELRRLAALDREISSASSMSATRIHSAVSSKPTPKASA